MGCVSEFNLRKTLSKFRCSDHTLEIELGRHKGIDANKRFCKFCVLKVENELHFLNECPVYSTIRDRFSINNLHWLTLIKCEEKYTSYCLANYLRTAFNHRDELLAVPK